MKKSWPALILIIMISCSSPLKKTYSRDTFEKDMAEIMKAYKQDTAILAAITKMAISIRFGKDQNFVGKSYQEIIADSEKDNLNSLKKNGEVKDRLK